LYEAASKDQLEVVRFLTENGEPQDDAATFSAFILASMDGHVAVAELLL
jgi:hypothetical protein